MRSSLVAQGIQGTELLGSDEDLPTILVVAPILLTKGLEFDVVIVAWADDKTFTTPEFDTMLLYLACTRAKRFLRLHWFGSLTRVVAQAGWWSRTPVTRTLERPEQIEENEEDSESMG